VAREGRRRAAPRLDDDIGLAGKAVLGGRRALPVGQWQPLHRPVGIESRDRKLTLVEQGKVRFAVVRIVAAAGDELVDVVEAFVVAGVDGDPAVAHDDGRGAFVLEAVERGALLGIEVGS
jgi:hypothetical protein